MESQSDRDIRLRKRLGFAGPEGRGITSREAAKLLHTGIGGESRQPTREVEKLLDSLDRDLRKGAGRRR
jgi:hypothetical protein